MSLINLLCYFEVVPDQTFVRECSENQSATAGA
jgi:hypothetical protein